MLKFNRNYKLTVQVDDDGTNLVIQAPLTLEFNVRREVLTSAGTANLKIYNINPANRNKIFKALNVYSKRAVKLEAGYGDSLSVIFTGFINEAKSYRQEGQVNFITEINAYDYAPQMPIVQSTWTLNAPPDITYEAILTKIITEDLGAGIGSLGSFKNKGVFSQQPVTFSMPAWEALKSVTGGKCYIDSGKVFCMDDNDVIEGTTTVINSLTGLLGSPKMNGMFVTFEMIFEPSLVNGQKIDLESDYQPRFNGTYKVVGLEHTGTISGAVAGKCKTKVILMFGNQGQSTAFNDVQEL